MMNTHPVVVAHSQATLAWGIDGEGSIKNGVRDLIAHFIGVTGAHALGGEKIGFGGHDRMSGLEQMEGKDERARNYHARKRGEGKTKKKEKERRRPGTKKPEAKI